MSTKSSLTVAEIQAKYDAGELTREDYKESVASVEGRPSYKATRKVQQVADDSRRIEQIEKELKELKQRRVTA